MGCVTETSKTDMPDSRVSRMSPQTSRSAISAPAAPLQALASRPGSARSFGSRVDTTPAQWMVWRKILSRISWHTVAFPCTEVQVMAWLLSSAKVGAVHWHRIPNMLEVSGKIQSLCCMTVRSSAFTYFAGTMGRSVRFAADAWHARLQRGASIPLPIVVPGHVLTESALDTCDD
jgi:hypothetical protein